MTSQCSVAPEDRRRSPLDHHPPPAASSGKPLTPFSIEDILKKPSVRRGYSLSHGRSSPLCALQELASKTFKGLEEGALRAAEGRDSLSLFGQRNAPKKRRKSRTAFTNRQIYELEKRFVCQKYLSPADRDLISQQLGLTNAQVITWFQNRRAKLKRDLEEMKADVESAKAVGAVETCAAVGGVTVKPVPAHPGLGMEPLRARSREGPHCAPTDWGSGCSEDGDAEIDVDDKNIRGVK
ncbi:transcription factor LBX1a [Phycodurus eques]|uniref:transcription factor LBX1a n=1 Tax=Phycodurus eques TaxID=693459 RepID=UPI002ACE401F|nr:transcription factor LBX1a [Phycodurus eques]